MQTKCVTKDINEWISGCTEHENGFWGFFFFVISVELNPFNWRKKKKTILRLSSYSLDFAIQIAFSFTDYKNYIQNDSFVTTISSSKFFDRKPIHLRLRNGEWVESVI